MINVTEVKVRLLNGKENGVIGWASCVVNNAISLSNIAVMYSIDGEITLSFPANITRDRRKHFHFKPITHNAADVLRKAIVKELEAVR